MSQERRRLNRLRDAVLAWWAVHHNDTTMSGDGDCGNVYGGDGPVFVRIAKDPTDRTCEICGGGGKDPSDLRMVTPELTIDTIRDCPTCDGVGWIQGVL